MRRAPAYTTTLGFAIRPASAERIRTDVQQLFSRSERLPSGSAIQVETDGPVLVLRGTVTDDHERRLAESIARLTPGVRELRNELTVRNLGLPGAP
jgi:osmotically-inducible protein OsmY